MALANFISTFNNFWRLDSKYKAKEDVEPLAINKKDRSRKWEKRWITKEFAEHTISIYRWIPIGECKILKNIKRKGIEIRKISRPQRKSQRVESAMFRSSELEPNDKQNTD
ncbi:hypothetical protein HZS_3999, partial [Henneguya salminicola]